MVNTQHIRAVLLAKSCEEGNTLRPRKRGVGTSGNIEGPVCRKLGLAADSPQLAGPGPMANGGSQP
jgi:hypothetical protein